MEEEMIDIFLFAYICVYVAFKEKEKEMHQFTCYWSTKVSSKNFLSIYLQISALILENWPIFSLKFLICDGNQLCNQQTAR